MIEGHGDDLYRYGDKVRHNFSSNIYTHVCHDDLMQHLVQCGELLRVYPSPRPEALLTALADREGIAAEDLLVTAGTVEAMYLIAGAHPGARSAIVSPTFSEYQDACLHHGHSVSHITRSQVSETDADIVWICNPNNPDGYLWPRHQLLRLIDDRPDQLFIVDTAYRRYACGETVTAADAASRHNLVTLHSLTKDFAVPGLRIGYMTMPRTAGINESALMPWRLNALAIEAAEWLLAQADRYRIDAASLHSEALRIAEALSSRGIAVEPTDCNFLLGCLPEPNRASDLKDRLVAEYGILIRDASNFHGLGAGHFRVAAQLPEQNNLLISAIGQCLI